MLAHADEITGVVGDNLRKARDWLGKARELVTVKHDVALPFKVADLAPRERDRERLAALFQRFGFKGWLKDVQGNGDSPAPAAAPLAPSASAVAPADVPRRYETVLTEADLARWIARLSVAEIVAFDTETTSLDRFAARLVGVSFSIAARRSRVRRHWRTRIPGPRTSSASNGRSRSSSRGSRMRRRRSSGRTRSTTSTCSRTTA